MSNSETISPTAHYTGYVWARNGLSHPALETVQGRLFYESLRLPNELSRVLGGPTLERYLLARHRAIDGLLERAIEEHGVTQVIEVAAGMSARGWRFTQRYGDRIAYVEADLPGMASRKRRALERIGPLGARHRVEEVDALRDSGPDSLPALADELDAESGLAIITEGLLGYVDSDAVAGIFRRFARVLGGFATGRYVSDLHLADLQTPEIKAFRTALSWFVRGRVHLHFDSAADAEAALRAAGFAHASVRRASELANAEGPETRLAHILEASTT